MTNRRTTLLGACLGLTVAIGCTASDGTPADSAAAPAAAPMPGSNATAMLAEQAGTWEGRSMPMEGDSVLASWRVVSTADTTGWTLTYPDGQPIPIRVLAVEGDSIVTEFGPYENPDQPGVMQTVRSVGRLQNGVRVGTYEVRLEAQPDSVIRGRWEATRVP